MVGEFIRNYLTPIFAALAFFQYWIGCLYRKYGKKGKIDIHETGDIEISYGPTGPAIKLQGTLRALNQSVFVKSMSLLLIRKEDDMKHLFRWLAFSSPHIYNINDQTIPLEMPYSFLVSTDAPHRYNIIFNDYTFFKDIKPLNNNYIAEWFKIVDEVNKTLPISGPKNLTPEAIELIDNFKKKNKVRTAIFTELDRKCYWNHGDYILILNICTSKPDKILEKTYQFAITENDSKEVRLNVIPILEEPIARYLQKQNYPYHYIHVPYKNRQSD